MNSRHSFDDALNEAINAVQGGSPLDEVMAIYPEYRDQLRPLLETASVLDPNGVFLPPTSRLQANLAIVQGALGAARERSTPRAEPKAWWQRRVTFASLSLPAGVFVFALVSAGGAAAATVAASTNLPSQLGEAAEQLTPAWSHSILPGGDDDASVQALATVEVTPDASAAPSTPTPVSAPATPAPVASPSAVVSVPGIQSFAGSGVIANVRGNTFELTDGAATFKIQLDAKTIVEGTVTEGAAASIEGTLTGNGRVHATRVVITTAPAEADPTSEPTESGDDKPAKTHTPPGQADKTKTAPGQAETKTPGEQGESNGNGGDGGGGNGNSNGNGNANNGNGSGR